MKKLIILLIIPIISIIAIQGCKTSDVPDPPPPKPQGVFLLEALEGGAIYDNFFETTTIHVSILIGSMDNIGGIISDWNFVVKKGNTTLLTIDKSNYLSYQLNASTTDGTFNIAANQKNKLTIEHEAGTNVSMSAFLYDDPDNVDFNVTITDNNGYVQSKTLNAVFTFTRLYPDYS